MISQDRGTLLNHWRIVRILECTQGIDMNTTQTEIAGLYSRALGPAWDDLHSAVRRFHTCRQPLRATGTFQVRHGNGWMTRLATRLAGMPAPGEAVVVQLSVLPHEHGEEWSRTFDNLPMWSFQTLRPNGIVAEAMGPMEVRFRLEVVDGALIYHPSGAALRLGRLRIPVPRWFAPSVSASEKPTEDPHSIQVLIEVKSAILGPMVSYGGIVRMQTE
jgi:hypothetical protein